MKKRLIGRLAPHNMDHLLRACTMKENTKRIKTVRDNIKFGANSRTEVISCQRLMTDLTNFHSHPFFHALPYFITFIIEWRGKESLRGKKVSCGESQAQKIHFRAACLSSCFPVLSILYRQIADPSSSASAVTLLRSGFVVTSLEKFVFACHPRKPKIHNKACDFPKPITSQTLLIHRTHPSRVRLCLQDLSLRVREEKPKSVQPLDKKKAVAA